MCESVPARETLYLFRYKIKLISHGCVADIKSRGLHACGILEVRLPVLQRLLFSLQCGQPLPDGTGEPVWVSVSAPGEGEFDREASFLDVHSSYGS